MKVRSDILSPEVEKCLIQVSPQESNTVTISDVIWTTLREGLRDSKHFIICSTFDINSLHVLDVFLFCY